MAEFQKTQISTNSLSFFNDDRVLLKMTYLEDAITVGIYFPQVVDGKATYPKEMRHQVLLNQKNVAAMNELIIHHILPAYNLGESKDVGVFTNRNSTQMFEIMVQGGNIIAIIHDEIENRVPKHTYMFKFDKTRVIMDYNVEALSFKTEEVDAQFFLFMKALSSFVELSNGITAHEYRYRNMYFNDQVRKHLDALNTKLGLGIQGYSSNAGTGNGNFRASGFESGNSYNPMETMGSPVEVHQGTMNDLFPGSGDDVPFR